MSTQIDEGSSTQSLRSERMKWLVVGAALLGAGLYAFNERVWDALFDAFGFDVDERVAGSIHFFLYDTAKIMLLLTVLIFLVGLLNTTISPERVRDFLRGKGFFTGLILAVVLGTITPFCSCSSVPVFIGLVGAGIPLSITLTFLISSPLISETGIIMMGASFGWHIALLWIAAGATLSLLAGIVISRFDLDKWVEPFVFASKTVQLAQSSEKPTFDQRFDASWEETKEIIRKTWPYVLVGIAIGAVIHGWVPEDFFAKYADGSNVLAVLFVTALGVPLYANPAGVVPMAEALHDKGAALGTVMAFMMSVVALSVPSLILLRRVLKPQLLTIFVAIVSSGILVIGIAFNIFVQ